ncbi:transposase (fragment) [Escherichia coli]
MTSCAKYVLMPGKVHADDIPVPVQEPGSGKTRTARTGKAYIHRITRPVTAVCFRPMLTVAAGRYTNPAE